MVAPDPKLKRIAFLRARKVRDDEIAREVGFSEETIARIASSDLFKGLEREESFKAMKENDGRGD